MQAYTINPGSSIRLTSFLPIGLFWRFSHQTAVRYFAAYGPRSLTEWYNTSDYGFSDFEGRFIGTGIRMAPPDGLFGTGHWQGAELRYGQYIRSTGWWRIPVRFWPKSSRNTAADPVRTAHYT